MRWADRLTFFLLMPVLLLFLSSFDSTLTRVRSCYCAFAYAAFMSDKDETAKQPLFLLEFESRGAKC